VSQFAAGCAVCGTDLVAAREQFARGRGRLPRMPGKLMTDETLMLVIAVIVAIAAPLIGIVLAGFFAWRADNEGQTRTRNLMLVVVAFAVLMLYAPFALWSPV
jgi:hypothetical protein